MDGFRISFESLPEDDIPPRRPNQPAKPKANPPAALRPSPVTEEAAPPLLSTPAVSTKAAESASVDSSTRPRRRPLRRSDAANPDHAAASADHEDAVAAPPERKSNATAKQPLHPRGVTAFSRWLMPLLVAVVGIAVSAAATLTGSAGYRGTAAIVRQYEYSIQNRVVRDPAALKAAVLDRQALGPVLTPTDPTAEALPTLVSVAVGPYAGTSDRVYVHVRAPSPGAAEMLALRLAETYANREKQRQPLEQRRAEVEQLRVQLAEADQRVLAAEKAEAEFARASSLEALLAAEAQLVAVRRQIKTLREQIPATNVSNSDQVVTPPLTPSAAQDDETMALRALRQLVRQRDELAMTYTESHPTVQSINRKIRQLADELKVANPDQLAEFKVVSLKPTAVPTSPASHPELDQLLEAERELARQAQTLPAVQEQALAYRASVEQAYAARNRLTATTKEIDEQATAATSESIRYEVELPESPQPFGQYRHAWFAAGVGLSLLLALGFGRLRGAASALPSRTG